MHATSSTYTSPETPTCEIPINGIVARSTEERRIRRIRKKKNAKSRFFTSRGEYVNLRYIAMLYTHSIGNQP